MGAAEIFQKGETVYLTAEIVDPLTGDLTNPDSVTVTIHDAKGQVTVDAAPMTALSTGRYCYYFDTIGETNLGVFTFKITATRASYITINNDADNNFTVE